MTLMNAERGTQVMLMRQIYESAYSVLVYLGETNESHQLVTLFNSMVRFSKLCLTEANDKIMKSRLTINWSNLAQHGLPDVHDTQWQSMIHLLEHPWFSRVWVFQESLVARRCTFTYGDFSIDQQALFTSLYIMDVNDFAGHIDGGGLGPVESSIRRCMSIFFRQESSTTPLSHQTWSRSPLIELLRDNVASNASDPRDHVFALLGVSNEAEEPDLRPDYLEILDQTYMRVAEFMVVNGYGPLLINSVSSRGREPGLPSWVPRWNSKGFNKLLHSRTQDHRVSQVFMAAGQTAQAFRIHESRKILVVRGIVWDTIERLGTCKFAVKSVDDADYAFEQIETTVACLSEILEMLRFAGNPYPSGEPKLEVVSRLSVCDRPRRQDEKAPGEYLRGLKALVIILAGEFRERNQFSPEYRINMINLLTEIMKATLPSDEIETREWAREFLLAAWIQFSSSIRSLTQKRYIGQVLPDAKRGDKVTIIQGCEVPYLLRPLGNNQYSIIGECYFHGVMYGEAWDENNVQDIEIV
jgi:hypothetical protein